MPYCLNHDKRVRCPQCVDEPTDYDWQCPEQKRAEAKAQRRANWRAFWWGFTHIFGGKLDWRQENERFWSDVRRFGGRA